MKLIWAFALILAVAQAASATVSSERKRYDNYRVYKIPISSKAQLLVINKILATSSKFNVWKDYEETSKEMHVMVAPEEIVQFSNTLKSFGLSLELLIPDVQRLINDEQVDRTVDSGGSSFGWTRYYKLHEIEAWLDEILANHTGVTEGFTIGKSYEGRTIRGIKITHGADKPGIFIESNIHAREWITSATATWFIHQLLTSPDEKIRSLAENYDWYIVPVFNVDGFVYSHETDRMWRKTRQPVSTSPCIGTDANRNFDSYWMVNNGASNNPCSETYAGTAPFSEPEARALADFVTSIKDKIKIYLSFHSYGQYLLSPYGHTTEEIPDNYDDLLSIGASFAGAIRDLPFGTVYTHGATSTTLYVASGSSVDYVFNELGVKIGFTIEYRDKGRYGFILPPVQILPNCQELMAGITALVEKTEELGYV